jgi:hypothetical protein
MTFPTNIYMMIDAFHARLLACENDIHNKTLHEYASTLFVMTPHSHDDPHISRFLTDLRQFTFMKTPDDVIAWMNSLMPNAKEPFDNQHICIHRMIESCELMLADDCQPAPLPKRIVGNKIDEATKREMWHHQLRHCAASCLSAIEYFSDSVIDPLTCDLALTQSMTTAYYEGYDLTVEHCRNIVACDVEPSPELTAMLFDDDADRENCNETWYEHNHDMPDEYTDCK